MPIILILLLLHVTGTIYQHFVLRTDVLRRMLRPDSQRASPGETGS